ncbi:phage tail protein [Morganella morganii]|uniref:phage tail protein n=1 Tax=Morganella morganii TaxID=582 RepID=UPI00069BDB6E|nr:phage tail protein [Morganella morganii]BEP21633.1 hypothetical protein SUGSMm_24300 [Morganella morganii subsp. sibonii]EGT3623346.1 phage tail protein [Morganella morganii]EGT3632235.1 phage tail protein [Morganella morganii]EGT3635552.1 phage tail protein [Morganella morganii]EKK5377103.1 phage tail protein [Morganella morganii]
MDEFKWRPEDACQINNEPKVRVAKFGNGYEQRAKDGINNQLKTYNLAFIKPVSVGREIDNFLSQRGAVESFLWLTGDDKTLRTFVCRNWQVTRKQSVWQIDCVFEEVVA